MVVNTTPPLATRNSLAKPVAIFLLYRHLTQDFRATLELPEKLVVVVVAVGEHDHGRVFHCGMGDDASRVKEHRVTFSGALRVPDAGASVARLPSCMRPVQ